MAETHVCTSHSLSIIALPQWRRSSRWAIPTIRRSAQIWNISGNWQIGVRAQKLLHHKSVDEFDSAHSGLIVGASNNSSQILTTIKWFLSGHQYTREEPSASANLGNYHPVWFVGWVDGRLAVRCLSFHQFPQIPSSCENLLSSPHSNLICKILRLLPFNNRVAHLRIIQ